MSWLDKTYHHPHDGEEMVGFDYQVVAKTIDAAEWALDFIQRKATWCADHHIHVAWHKPRLGEYILERPFYFRSSSDAVFFKTACV